MIHAAITATQLRAQRTCCCSSCAVLQGQACGFVFACSANASDGSTEAAHARQENVNVRVHAAAPVKPDVSDTSNLLEDLVGAVNRHALV